MATEPLAPGGRLGKYQVLDHVATGGMGVVYKALDEQLGRTVALKVLAPQLVNRPALRERFRREARNAARLSHENIITLYEYGEVEGTYFLVMEYVEGIDLNDYIHRKGKLDPEEARRVTIQAAKALDHAYQRGVTHRDIKPHNFMLTQQEGRTVVKMTDLGLAMTDEEEFRVTRAGTTVGTVDYLSPEQARDSASADIRSDIYSLGCTLYHMLSGQPPFAEGGLGERIYKHMEVEPPDVRDFNPQVSDNLWAVLRRMLAKQPEDRYATPADLILDLKGVNAPRLPSRPAPPPTPLSLPELPPWEESPESEAPTKEEIPQPAKPTANHRHPRRRRRTQPVKEPVDAADVLGLSDEVRLAAAGQFERAQEVCRTGNSEYALRLLLSCCKLDPGNIQYRQTLREVERSAAGQKWGGWLSSLGALAAKTRLRAARRAQDHRKVLEHGEEVLARSPQDAGAQIDMADAADALGLTDMAVWLLEQAKQQDPRNTTVQKALAGLHEKHQRYRQAIAVWEQVRKTDPADRELLRKISDLAANETIARGRYGGR